MVLLKDGKRVLVGAVYRSPNSPEENYRKMLDILRIFSCTNADYLLVCGDFNLPKIDGMGKQCLDSDTSFTAEFLETVEHLNWYQHSRNHTRFRGVQKSCLDLIFTNEEDMIGEVLELPPIGKSDQVCQKWELVAKEAIFKNMTVRRPNFKLANC